MVWWSWPLGAAFSMLLAFPSAALATDPPEGTGSPSPAPDACEGARPADGGTDTSCRGWRSAQVVAGLAVFGATATLGLLLMLVRRRDGAWPPEGQA